MTGEGPPKKTKTAHPSKKRAVRVSGARRSLRCQVRAGLWRRGDFAYRPRWVSATAL